MKAFRKKTQTLSLGLPFAMALTAMATFALNGCGSDDSSSANNETGYVVKYSSEASSDIPETSSESKVSENSSSSTTSDTPKSSASKILLSSSAKQETQSSEELLNEPTQKVSGTCYAKTPIIEKGGVATWEFARSTGDIFDGIMAPYVWTFADIDKTLQGNGLNSVNLKYEDAGTYYAKLSVDGNEITCDPLQVQGIPITISSCKPNAETIKAGETITWTVEAESEASITGYAWTSTFGEVSGNSTTGSMTATSDMHKQKVTATVAISNSDKTTQTYLCEGATVLDPESVDLVLGLGSINDQATYGEEVIPTLPDSLFITANTPMTVQVPTGAPSNCTIGCKPKISSDYMSLQVTWEGEELTSFAYFGPAGCAPGKKYSVTTSVTAICVVNK